MKPLPAEELADATPPPERKRLADDLHVLATTVEHLVPVSVFTDDQVLTEAQRLRYWLDVQIEAAARQREFDRCDPVVWEPPDGDGPLIGG